MKRIILSLLIATIGCVSAFAGAEIKLVSGSLKEFKDGGTGCVVIDMNDTKFDNKEPLRQDERFADVDEQLPECAREFVREFNENAKKFKLTESADEAQYEILVKITNLDVFVNVMSFKGGVGIKLWGDITITNKTNNEVVATYKIDEEENSGFSYRIALEEGFEGIAKFLAKKINKAK